MSEGSLLYADKVQMHVAETVTLDITLMVTSGDRIIDVNDVTPAIDTTTSENATGITEKLVTDLPLSVSGNMRNPERFIFLFFDRVVYGAPESNISAANFGIVSSQSNAPRQGQMALRLEF